MIGGTLPDGPKPAGVTADEQHVIWRIHQRRSEGAQDSTIFKELKREHGVSRADFDRLKKFPPSGLDAL